MILCHLLTACSLWYKKYTLFIAACFLCINVVHFLKLATPCEEQILLHGFMTFCCKSRSSNRLQVLPPLWTLECQNPITLSGGHRILNPWLSKQGCCRFVVLRKWILWKLNFWPEFDWKILLLLLSIIISLLDPSSAKTIEVAAAKILPTFLFPANGKSRSIRIS